MNKTFEGVLLSIASALCFATLAIFAKFGYQKGYDTNTLLFFRFLFASIIFFLFIVSKQPNLLKIKRNQLIKCLFVGFVLYGLQATFFFISVKYIGASMTSFILYTYPLTVTVLSIILFKQNQTAITWITLFITLIGLIFIFYNAISFDFPLKGIIFSVLATLTFSIYLITVQIYLKDINSYTFTFYILIFAVLFFAIFGINKISLIKPSDFIFFIGLGFIPTSFGIILLYKAIEILNSSLVSIISTIEPFATLLMSYIFFKEKIGYFQIIGGILITIGIIILNLQWIINRHEKKIA